MSVLLGCGRYSPGLFVGGARQAVELQRETNAVAETLKIQQESLGNFVRLQFRGGVGVGGEQDWQGACGVPAQSTMGQLTCSSCMRSAAWYTFMYSQVDRSMLPFMSSICSKCQESLPASSRMGGLNLGLSCGTTVRRALYDPWKRLKLCTLRWALRCCLYVFTRSRFSRSVFEQKYDSSSSRSVNWDMEPLAASCIWLILRKPHSCQPGACVLMPLSTSARTRFSFFNCSRRRRANGHTGDGAMGRWGDEDGEVAKGLPENRA